MHIEHYYGGSELTSDPPGLPVPVPNTSGLPVFLAPGPGPDSRFPTPENRDFFALDKTVSAGQIFFYIIIIKTEIYYKKFIGEKKYEIVYQYQHLKKYESIFYFIHN